MSANTSNEKYHRIPRELTSENSFTSLSGSAFKLFLALNELESRKYKELVYDKSTGYFWFLCTDAQIRDLTGMNEKTIQKAKKELKEHGFIHVARGNWHYAATGKSDIKQPCKYYIIK